MNKIVHFTTVHPRFDGRIFQKECRSLAQKGFDVHLVVADSLGNDVYDGVTIHDIEKSSLGRLGRFILKTTQMYFRVKALKGDLYHFHDPELILTGLLLRLSGNKVVFDIHENLPLQIMHKYWIPMPLRKITSLFYSAVEGLCCRIFNGLLVPQPTMKQAYLKLNRNTELIGNFVDTENIILPTSDLKKNRNSKFVLVHAGALSEERGAINMLNLLSSLDSTYELYLAGNVASKALRVKLEKHSSWDKVKFYGVVSHSKINELYNESKVGLILYNNVGQYYLSYAIKLFEFMARGIPVIMPNFGEWPKFNQQYNCGICVDVTDSESVARAVEYLNENSNEREILGNNGKNAIENKFNWRIESEKLISFYLDILKTSK